MHHYFQKVIPSKPRPKPVRREAPADLPISEEKAPRPRLLVVDDSQMVRLIVSRALTNAGFDVEVAENGEVALQKAHDLRPDLILMDVNMPVMDGWEAIRQLKANPALRDIVVIFLSTNAEDADLRYARTCGAHSYLIKPVADEALVAHVQTALATRKRKPKRIEDCCILIVDDSGLIRNKVKLMLEELGCHLLEARDGKEACDIAKVNIPDLILMDINMPVMDGLEATRLIRENPDLHDTIIVAVTASSQREDLVQAMRAGVRDYMIKPFTNDQLLDRVRHNLAA